MGSSFLRILYTSCDVTACVTGALLSL